MVNQGCGIQLLHLLRSYLHRDDPFEQRSLSGVRVKADSAAHYCDQLAALRDLGDDLGLTFGEIL